MSLEKIKKEAEETLKIQKSLPAYLYESRETKTAKVILELCKIIEAPDKGLKTEN